MNWRSLIITLCLFLPAHAYCSADASEYNALAEKHKQEIRDRMGRISQKITEKKAEKKKLEEERVPLQEKVTKLEQDAKSTDPKVSKPAGEQLPGAREELAEKDRQIRAKQGEIDQLNQRLTENAIKLAELEGRQAQATAGDHPPGKGGSPIPPPAQPPPDNKKEENKKAEQTAAADPKIDASVADATRKPQERLLTQTETPGTGPAPAAPPERASVPADQIISSVQLADARTTTRTIENSNALADGIRNQNGGTRPVSGGGSLASVSRPEPSGGANFARAALSSDLASATRSAETARAAVPPSTARGATPANQRLISGLGFSVAPQMASFGMEESAAPALSKNPSGRAFTSSPQTLALRNSEEEKKIAKFMAESLPTARGSTAQAPNYVANFQSKR